MNRYYIKTIDGVERDLYFSGPNRHVLTIARVLIEHDRIIYEYFSGRRFVITYSLLKYDLKQMEKLVHVIENIVHPKYLILNWDLVDLKILPKILFVYKAQGHIAYGYPDENGDIFYNGFIYDRKNP